MASAVVSFAAVIVYSIYSPLGFYENVYKIFPFWFDKALIEMGESIH